MNTKKRRSLIVMMLSLASLLPSLSAQTTAFLGVSNATKDARLDYLSPIIEGTLLYDLSVRGNLAFVERTRIDALMREQDLQLAGITDSKTMAKTGKILNADWLLSGSYSLAGSDVFASFSLIEVETGVSLTFTDRGTGENLVHRIAERIIQRLSKRSVELADDSAERSILSLRDERPGTIVLYSRMQAARIFIDNEFAGFTQGKEQDGIVFDSLPPGKHRIRTHLSNDFGVIYPGDLSFRDWEQVVEVKPGRRLAVLDQTYDLYNALRTARTLVSQRLSAGMDDLSVLGFSENLRYTDSAGISHAIVLSVTPPTSRPSAGAVPAALKVSLRLDQQEKTEVLAFNPESGKKNSITIELGKLSLQLTLSHWANQWDLDRELLRTDIPDSPRRVNAPLP